MNVRVKLHGVLNAGAGDSRGRTFDLVLSEETTAGDVLRALAERWGTPFRELLESSDQRLPRHIRMFADGVLLVNREQSVAPTGASANGVSVVLLTPMMGG